MRRGMIRTVYPPPDTPVCRECYATAVLKAITVTESGTYWYTWMCSKCHWGFSEGRVLRR